MREYALAAILILLAALAGAGYRGRLRDPAVWLGLIAFALLTVAADVALTAIGIYHYARQFNAGISIGRMPIEDLVYGVALYLVAVTVWTWKEARAR